jgi:two-component sensor histidine kinase
LLSGSFLARRISRSITSPFATLRQIAVAPDNDRFDTVTAATGLREADEVAQALIAEKRSRHEATAGLQRALQQRTAALGQRDLLLREVYHRVKNNLQLVDSLLAMQISQTANREVGDELSELRSRVYALGLVHQQLMASADLRSFDIAPFLHQPADNVMAAGGRRYGGVHVKAVSVMVTLDFAIPLGLLVNELITNGFKHAHPLGCAEVFVTLEHDSVGDVVLTVAADQSCAADAESSQSLTATRASTYKQGLGVEITMGLAAQIDGVMTVRDADFYSTEVRIPAARILRE